MDPEFLEPKDRPIQCHGYSDKFAVGCCDSDGCNSALNLTLAPPRPPRPQVQDDEVGGSSGAALVDFELILGVLLPVAILVVCVAIAVMCVRNKKTLLILFQLDSKDASELHGQPPLLPDSAGRVAGHHGPDDMEV